MSTMTQDQQKIVLSRTGPDQFWELIHTHYASGDPQKWKYLAMLALRENCGWTLERIGEVFSHNKGHVSRCLERVKKDLRGQIQISPDILDDSNDIDRQKLNQKSRSHSHRNSKAESTRKTHDFPRKLNATHGTTHITNR
jgi:hypothetical protein